VDRPCRFLRLLAGAVIALACGGAAAAAGDAPAGGSNPDPQARTRAAFEAAGKAALHGPRAVAIADKATLQLPAGYAFIPIAEAGELLQAFGNTLDPGFQGIVVPRSQDRSFSFYNLSYHDSGYIKDDDARDWNADELLQQVRQGTETGNQRRREMGAPEIEVTGWIEKPRYDAASHEVVWSLGVRGKGAPAGEAGSVNTRTLVLGRDGYVAMTLVTDPAHVEALRPDTARLLDALTFNEGRAYADFKPGTDRVAEIGLAALVAGVAAKKLGLIAVAVAFFVKFAKVIVVAVIGAGVALRKWLGWRARPAPASAAAPPPAAADALAPSTTPPGSPPS
jgi:uncharacterized membrane-anchored protein